MLNSASFLSCDIEKLIKVWGPIRSKINWLLIALYSGGHLNPAVTIGVFISGGLNIVAVPLYFAAQIAGSIAGSACVLVSRKSLSHTA